MQQQIVVESMHTTRRERRKSSLGASAWGWKSIVWATTDSATPGREPDLDTERKFDPG